MNDKLRTYLQLMSYFTLALVLGTIFTVFYWRAKAYKPLVFNEDYLKVSNKEVHQGEYLKYEIDYCKNSDKVPDLTRSFVDGVIYSIPGDTQPFLQEGCQVQEVQIYIPKALPASEYHLEGTYRFQVNPLRTVDVYFKTENFEVLEKELNNL